MQSRKAALILGIIALFRAAAADASQVTWGAYTTNGVGIADAGGQRLPQGDIVLLGHFNLTNAQIMTNGSDEAFLMANFVQYASSFVGAGQPNGPGAASDGYWLANSVNSSNLLAIQGTEMYYWVFNAATVAGASQYGIFTAPTSTALLFPNDTAVPPTTITDINQVPHDSTGILWGSFGTGISGDNLSPLYDLAPFAAVPEPATWGASILVALAIAFTARPRRRKSRTFRVC